MGGLLTHLSPQKKFIDETISDHCIVVFAKSDCPYSQLAKDVFDAMKLPYKAVDIDRRLDGDQIQKILGQTTDADTGSRTTIPIADRH